MGVRDALKKVMAEEQWQYQEAPDAHALRAGYRGKTGLYLCFARWNESDDLFTFYAVPQLAIPKEKYGAAMETITRANFGLPVGNFELDVDDGELRFRASLDAEGVEVAPALIRTVIMHAVTALDRYLPALIEVVEKGAAPRAAIARIEEQRA